VFGRDFNPFIQVNNEREKEGTNKNVENQSNSNATFKGPLPPFPPPPLGRSLPVNRKAFHEIRNFIILTIISEHSNKGITGYQLQERYGFPRGTLLRTLQSFENKNYVDIREEVIQGRANKFYVINSVGKEYLNTLRQKWANLFAMMTEKANPERCEHPFAREWFRLMIIDHIKVLDTKEEAEAFFIEIKGGIDEIIRRFSSRIQKLKHFRKEIDPLINLIEKMEPFNREMLKEAVYDFFSKLKEEMQENN
jgi:DNA-binding PadR family transcriptional regulator